MAKLKQQTHRLMKRDRKRAGTRLRSFMRSFTLEQWLMLIAKADFHGFSYEHLYRKPEYLCVVSDMAIRLSSSVAGSEWKLPSEVNIERAFSGYLASEESTGRILKGMGVGAVPLVAAYQNRFNNTMANVLGRMHLLYNEYDADVIEGTGLSIKDIYLITMGVMGTVRRLEGRWVTLPSLHHAVIPSFSPEKVDAYFKYFSRTQEEYIKEAKAMGIYENSFGRFNQLNRFPIIELSPGAFFVPVVDQLIDSISASLYNHIFAVHMKKGRKATGEYMGHFGEVFEQYVLSHPIAVFGKESVNRAESVVEAGLRCEAIITFGDSALAIEVKKMDFKMNAIPDGDIGHINDVLERHIVKAYGQIENTYIYMPQKLKYGLIVIPDVMVGASALRGYLVDNFEREGVVYDESIFICPLSSFEALMANTPEIIFEVLDRTAKRSSVDGNDPVIVLHEMNSEGKEVYFVNPRCKSASDEVLSSILPAFSN